MRIICISVAILCSSLSTATLAQTAQLEGYVFEQDNRGYIQNVDVKILDKSSRAVVAQTTTNADGVFKTDLPLGKEYEVVAEKKLFFKKSQFVSTKEIKEGAKVYAKLEMERKPGYIFDVTIAEPRNGNNEMTVNAIDSARIDIYNNTTFKEELVLDNWPHPTFKFSFEQGNHYTILIRRDGYFNKRIEAYVNVEGCILCFDGLGTVEPGVTDVMSHGNEMGTFLANIELEPLALNKTFVLENIYYDFDKWDIRKDAAYELDKLVGVLKDNPAVSVELGSHTDSRGSDSYNMTLSQKRAQAAVEYILNTGVITSKNISSRGYGETVAVNGCRNGVTCGEEEHQRNRRTELKITGIDEIDPLENKSLKEIIEEERLLNEVLNQEVRRFTN